MRISRNLIVSVFVDALKWIRDFEIWGLYYVFF